MDANKNKSSHHIQGTLLGSGDTTVDRICFPHRGIPRTSKGVLNVVDAFIFGPCPHTVHSKMRKNSILLPKAGLHFLNGGQKLPEHTGQSI